MYVLIGFFIFCVKLTNGQSMLFNLCIYPLCSTIEVCSELLALPADGGCCAGSYCCAVALGTGCCCDQPCFDYGDCCDDVSEINCVPTLSQMKANPGKNNATIWELSLYMSIALCTDNCAVNGFTACCENNCVTLCCSCDYECHNREDCCNDIEDICQMTTEPPPQVPNVCKKETDNVYNLDWPDTYAAETAQSVCPANKIG